MVSLPHLCQKQVQVEEDVYWCIRDSYISPQKSPLGRKRKGLSG